MPNLKDHVMLAVLALVILATLACYTVLAVLHDDTAASTLRDVLLAEVGGLLGVSYISKPASTDVQQE